ncbi:MAG: DNA replication/repair protein RecF [Anaerovoracaceae bacterium]|nr:DNA replication/repair protein RecF [Anaerovoracaceae bacterium]
MYIKSIELKNFRNYKEAKMDFHEKVNIFAGKNAQGKTNLLESIYLSAVGKSFRTNRDRDLVNFEADFCRVVTEYENGGDGKIEISISKDGNKKARVNGINASKASDFIDNIYVVVFSPEDLRIVKDEPEKRREFIDRELSQIKVSYLVNLYNYKKVLQQRNAYLKEENIERAFLDVWTENLIKFGSRIIEDRKSFIDKLGKISGEVHSGITAGAEQLTVNYIPNIETEENTADQIKAMGEVFDESLEEDLKNRTTTRGPHRDDIDLLVNGINVRKFGSQGQQRTAALALKLAEIELIKEDKGTAPVLLLDDVLSELDPARQSYLISSLSGVQLFITATDISDVVRGAFREGKVSRISTGNIL